MGKKCENLVLRSHTSGEREKKEETKRILRKPGTRLHRIVKTNQVVLRGPVPWKASLGLPHTRLSLGVLAPPEASLLSVPLFWVVLGGPDPLGLCKAHHKANESGR
jgi:hypothetical protein